METLKAFAIMGGMFWFFLMWWPEHYPKWDPETRFLAICTTAAILITLGSR